MTCADIGLTANIAGLSYDLNSAKIRLMSYDLGLSSNRRLSQRSPNQIYGDSDLGFRVDPRFSDWFWNIKGDTLADYRNQRALIMEIFQPRDNDPVQLVLDLGDRVRALDVNLDGELLFSDRVEKIENVSGVFKSSDPRLYHPTLITEVFDLAGSSGSNLGWAIPWPIPWGIGTDILNLVKVIEYADLSRLGAPEYPVIRIIGPIDNPVIANETTGEIIDLSDGTGISLADSSEWVEVDLADFPRRESKTIRNQDGESVDQYLTTDSDLATFHIAPAGEKLSSGAYCTGENTIRISGTGVDSTTQVSLKYYDRYRAV